MLAAVLLSACDSSSPEPTSATTSVSGVANDTTGGLRIAVTPTHVVNGETVVVAGTGCVTPATGSGAGLLAGVLVVVGGNAWVQRGEEPTAEVRPDGSFTKRVTISDSVPPGAAQVIAQCGEPRDDVPGIPGIPGVPGVDVIATAPSVPITVATPYAVEVAPTTLEAGGTLELHAECPQEGGSPGYQVLSLRVEPPIEESDYLPGLHFMEGRADGDVQVPRTAAPGTYTVTPECTIQRTPTTRYCRPFILTITPPESPVPR